jgi:hypothetical protein
MTEEALFEMIAGVPVSQRGAILDRECAGNHALRARVEALLSADANPDLTIDQPMRHNESSVATVGTVGSMIAGKYKLIEAIGVEVRRGDLAAVTAEIRVTEIVREDEQHVRPLWIACNGDRRMENGRHQKRQGERYSHG